MVRRQLEPFVNHQWYHHTTVFWITLPLSWLFRCVVATRRMAYHFGWFKSTQVSVPVWVIGNITIGGTGKTPLIIYLANFLQEQGIKVGIISRGYGSTNLKPKLVSHQDSGQTVGDEAVMLFTKVTCPIVVCQSRVAAAEQLISQHAVELILSDDGLQHYALARDVEIAVINGQRKFGNGQLLPTGPLRESKQRLTSVDCIIEQTDKKITAPGFSLKTKPLYPLIPQKPETLPKATIIDAVCGIGNPDAFKSTLTSMGYQVRLHAFPDHHVYTAHDFSAFSDGSAIVITEKDAVKCQKFADKRFWVCAVIAEPNTALKQWIRQQVQLLKE